MKISKFVLFLVIFLSICSAIFFLSKLLLGDSQPQQYYLFELYDSSGNLVDELVVKSFFERKISNSYDVELDTGQHIVLNWQNLIIYSKGYIMDEPIE